MIEQCLQILPEKHNQLLAARQEYLSKIAHILPGVFTYNTHAKQTRKVASWLLLHHDKLEGTKRAA
jgi:hypothetical protein